jgi:exportin-5
VELAATLERTDEPYDIDKLRKDKTKALLEGTRPRVYNVLGMCASVEGAYSELLDSLTVQDFLTNYIGPMELRHLAKVIRLVAIPLVKNCPCKFWKPWMVDFLGPILRECEYRLDFISFDLLHKGGTGKPYFYGKLVGSDTQIKESEQKLLLAFTRQVWDLLRVLALTEQNMESASSSLLSFLLRPDCFRRMRMSLFGYFVDDETTKKAIPFCRSLTLIAIDDMSVRHSIVNDLLPCLIQCLDNQLPCAIQRLRRKLGSSTTASASKDLEALCEEWYNHGWLRIE